MRFFKMAVIVALSFVIALSTAYSTNMHAYAADITGSTNNENNLISGIVMENNPSLGYITLYFKDGSGVDDLQKLVNQRTFTYGYDMPVIRDGITVQQESIQPGDQVFIKLDQDGYIVKLSAKSYYKPVYGLVHNKSSLGLVIKKDNGTYSYYPVTDSIPVYRNGKLGGLSDIKPGERVKLLVQTNGEFIDIAGIDIQRKPINVSGIYRGNIEYFNTMRDSLLVSKVQEFINGRWENTSFKGIQSIGFMNDYRVRPPKKISGTVYYITQKSTDGTYKIKAAAYRLKPQYELVVSDNLINLDGENRIELENSSVETKYDANTLVIKDEKLVDISALDSFDTLKLSMEKSLNTNNYIANVIVSDSVVNQGLTVYRGRVKDVEEQKSITLESFAQLNGISWEFTNTPKTFDVDLSVSRLLVDGGIGNMRNFDDSYVEQTVYIAAIGTRIHLISTAPYADTPALGRILSLTGGTYDSMGYIMTQPTSISITEAMVYSTTDYKWSESPNISMAIPSNAIVIKKDQVGSTALLKPGDQIKVMRHAQSEDGIIILCE